MQSVLTFNRFYLPGYQAGGPIVSIANMVATLGDDVSFFIVTTDRDINDRVSYPKLATNSWIQQGKASVLYLEKSRITTQDIVSIFKRTKPGTIYLNSFFDTWFTSRILLARRLARFPKVRVVLAPRGEFSPGALDIKSAQKFGYIAAAKAFGLLRGIEWHASTAVEAMEIRAALGESHSSEIHIAADLGSLPDTSIFERWQQRERASALRVCFISRISPKKNLLGAIRALSNMRLPARLDIYGPIEDARYWADCQKAIAALPAHLSATYCGVVEPAQIHATLVDYDVFLFPTFGENYGHVIPEALSVGLPVLISDKTPWRDLAEKGIGYDGPLNDTTFALELDAIASRDGEQMKAMRLAARRYAQKVLSDSKVIEANRRLFID